jgi:hypothetical protein
MIVLMSALLWAAVSCESGAGDPDLFDPGSGPPEWIVWDVPGTDPGPDAVDAVEADETNDGIVDDPGTPDGDVSGDKGPDDAETDPGGTAGAAQVSPSLIDFGYVTLGRTVKAALQVRNTGTAPLEVRRFVLDGPDAISLSAGVDAKVVAGKREYALEPPVEVLPGQFHGVEVFLTPVADAEVYGELTVHTSDPASPNGLVVHVLGNRRRACARLIPGNLDFGTIVVGEPLEKRVEIESCEQLDLELHAIDLDAAALAAGFVLDARDLPDQAFPSPQNPLMVPSGTRAILHVRYNPASPTPTDEDGAPVIVRGQVSVSGNMFSGGEFLPVQGAAVLEPCVVPRISLDMAGDVSIGTILRFSGLGTSSPFGNVAAWNWTVSGPAGHGGAMWPSSDIPEPLFVPGVAGPYTFSLQATDDAGNPSCSTAERAVTVLPGNRAVFLVSWKPVNPFTPIPPRMGPDVDLHVLHPNAADVYDMPWDCCWENPDPFKDVWAPPDRPWCDDRVRMTSQNEDGSVPEVVVAGMDCRNAAPDGHFRVRVHFYDSFGYGDVRATLQVWAGGTQVYATTQRLASRDLWEAGSLAWGTNVFTAPATPVIRPGYVYPPVGAAQ